MFIHVHGDCKEVSQLLCKALLPRRVDKITQHEAHKCLKGKRPKQWTLSAVCLNMKTWLTTVWTWRTEANNVQGRCSNIPKYKTLFWTIQRCVDKVDIRGCEKKQCAFSLKWKFVNFLPISRLETTVGDQLSPLTTSVAGISLPTGGNWAIL